jgi:hypothetical protein
MVLGSGPFEVKEVRIDGTPAFAVPGSFLEINRTADTLYDILPITFNLVESGKPDTLLVVESECAAACERSGICRDRELTGELNSFSLDHKGPIVRRGLSRPSSAAQPPNSPHRALIARAKYGANQANAWERGLSRVQIAPSMTVQNYSFGTKASQPTSANDWKRDRGTNE